MERLVSPPRAADRPLRRAGPLRSLRSDQAAPLVGRTGGDHRRCRPRAAAEYRTGWRMRHDERAVACGASRTQCRPARSAREVGKERAADHRTRATDFIFARPPHHLAPRPADVGTRLGGALEMAGRPAHQNGIAPPDGNDAVAWAGASVSVALFAMMRYHREEHQDDGTRP